MNETMFKILMHCGAYVDSNMLEEGIYSTKKPQLFSKNDTIELIEEKGRMMKDMMGIQMISERYFKNLRQCQLVDVSLLIGA